MSWLVDSKNRLKQVAFFVLAIYFVVLGLAIAHVKQVKSKLYVEAVPGVKIEGNTIAESASPSVETVNQGPVAEPDPPTALTTEWTGGLLTMKDPVTYNTLSADYELGLRSDGVVVWRILQK